MLVSPKNPSNTMRDATGRISYYLQNQSVIDLMYKAWILILSIGILQPVRWLPHLFSRPKTCVLPATLALISCGELVLGNPTLNPPGPFCAGDVVQISF